MAELEVYKRLDLHFTGFWELNLFMGLKSMDQRGNTWAWDVLGSDPAMHKLEIQ